MNDLSPVVLCLRAFVDARNREFWPLYCLLTEAIQKMEKPSGQRFVATITDRITGCGGESEKEDGVYLVIAASLLHPQGWEFEWVLSIRAFADHFQIDCAVDVMGDAEDGEAECRDVFLESESVSNLDQAIESMARQSRRVCMQTQFLDLFLRPALGWHDFPLLHR